MENCLNCLYANEKDNGGVMCDKVLLIYGKEVHIEADRVELPCPSHSDRYIENWRYVNDGDDLRKAEDSCEVCGRLINLDDESQYGYIEIQDELGNPSGEKLQCKICRHKGRR